ncbi:hypothetical protein FM106_15000 [Brachybacterium faecium]|nr:hypothetical protein FM106_15000 [Brachybacterium faecium]
MVSQLPHTLSLDICSLSCSDQLATYLFSNENIVLSNLIILIFFHKTVYQKYQNNDSQFHIPKMKKRA